MDNYVIELINKFGYFGMFLGMVLEAVIIIIPSELILATGGILAGRGIFNFWMSFFIGLLGSIFCAVVIYAMGYFGGYAFVNKYGKYFFMKEEDIRKSNTWFDKYAYQVVINKKYLSQEQLEELKLEPIELKPWDPLGTLA